MTALEILRDIIHDGHLSEMNMQRGRQLLDTLDTLKVGHKALLEDCQSQYLRGDRIAAVKRFRNKSGCGLREALDAVGQGAPM